MKTLCVPGFVILTLVSAVMPLSAHHSWPISRDRLVTVKGTVIEFKWANPHPMMTLEVQADDGRTERWQIGGPAIIRMESNGWTKTTVKPGDTSTITATGVSPQNRPLTYSFTSSAGQISGTGNTATLTTTGAPACAWIVATAAGRRSAREIGEYSDPIFAERRIQRDRQRQIHSTIAQRRANYFGESP